MSMQKNPFSFFFVVMAAVFSSVAMADDASFDLDENHSLYLEFENTKQVVNLSKNPARMGQRLELANYRNGFLVSNSYELSVGLNFKRSFSLDESFLEDADLKLGLRPLIGTTVACVRFLPAVAALSNSADWVRPLPGRAEDIQSWADGDSISYSSVGGLQLTVGFGLDPGTLNTKLIVKGEFETSIEKIDRDHVHVKFTDTKLTSYKIQAEVEYATIEFIELTLSQYRKLAGSLSYRIDISRPEGKRAFARILRGNIAGAQRLAVPGPGDRVFEKADSVADGRQFEIFLGIPFLLNANLSFEKVSELETTRSFAKDTLVSAKYGTYINKSKLLGFGRQAFGTEAAYGTAYTQKNLRSGKVKRGRFAQYYWSSEKSDASSSSMRRAVQELIGKTGFRRFLAVDVPESASLGYASVSFRIHFPQASLDRAMAKTLSWSEGSLMTLTENLIVESETQGDIQAAGYAIAKVKYAALEMEKALRSGNERVYANSSALFIKNMMENHFVLRLMILLAGGGVRMEYQIKGRDISRYSRVSVSPSDGPRALKMNSVLWH